MNANAVGSAPAPRSGYRTGPSRRRSWMAILAALVLAVAFATALVLESRRQDEMVVVAEQLGFS